MLERVNGGSGDIRKIIQVNIRQVKSDDSKHVRLHTLQQIKLFGLFVFFKLPCILAGKNQPDQLTEVGK